MISIKSQPKIPRSHNIRERVIMFDSLILLMSVVLKKKKNFWEIEIPLFYNPKSNKFLDINSVYNKLYTVGSFFEICLLNFFKVKNVSFNIVLTKKVIMLKEEQFTSIFFSTVWWTKLLMFRVFKMYQHNKEIKLG